MGKETPLVTQTEARKVRKRIATVGVKALHLLAAELEAYRRDNASPSETWVKKYKYIADQLRRDYRLDSDGDAALPIDEAPPADDPLAGLKVVRPKEAG